MPEVLVRNLDPDVIDRLKARARERGRSLQAELKLLLEQATRTAPSPARPASRASYRTLADQLRKRLSEGTQTDSAALLAEDRAR